MRRTYTSGSGSNVSTTWTARYLSRLPHRGAGWWGVLDALGHQLKMPKSVMRPICDHYDIALGIPRDDLIEMDYKGVAPWWL